MAFDPVPACFCGVQFLPVPRVERLVLESLGRYRKVTGCEAVFPIDIETIVEVVESIPIEFLDEDSDVEPDVLGAFDFTRGVMQIREYFDHEGRRRFTWA